MSLNTLRNTGLPGGRDMSASHSHRGERDTRIDAVRAVILTVVIIMNMMTLSGLAYLSPDARAELLAPVDQWAWDFLAIFLDGKALAAFSFMFGLSFSMILSRAGPENGASSAQIIRRFLVLGAIGLFNAVFLFWADILMTYAALGLLLPLAARLPQRIIIGAGTALILAGPVALALSGIDPPAPVPEGRDDSLQAFASSNYADTITQNLNMVTGAADTVKGTLVLRFFMLSGLFLLGLAVGRSTLTARFEGLRAPMFKLGALSVVIGLAAGATLRLTESPEGVWFLLYLETPVMALGYLMLLTAALHGKREGKLHSLLAPLGRMSLTGYLGASILGQLLFYGWGFQLIGQAGTISVMAIALAVTAALVGFAHLWFRHFVYGPWEWLWRSLTHLSPQPIVGRGAAS
ncbi:uncharacterized protein LY39_00699 [Roseinatronobacter bogoriensis subsp. barguzinensis]|uniref:DUF418 domain-containing protein n=2 Tax=Roseinatronobacter bogoriensis TaxID=119542 RepID=A0A2K8KCV6_9RHOB|nr:DUF418 domain-containing protein [Rhodobaca barguzinensis]TDW41592.1 uncharacterized protein LY39_00699 [Rhodobaca barguzinensis]TDY74229.1 uncharacterized protein EV660_101265 [Rhodobaca bogoriensis DSM 18756]